MSALVIVNRITGPAGSPVYTNFANSHLRASASDDPTPGVLNPITIPNPGQVHRSFWLSFQLETLIAPPVLLNNVRLSTDGVNSWPGVDVAVALASAYVEATGVEGVSGDALNSTNHPSLLFEPVPLKNYTSGAPLVLEASTSSVEKFGELIVLQLTGTAQAISGTLPVEAMTLTWDEV